MSQSKFTASERADKCVLSLEQAIYQTTKREPFKGQYGKLQEGNLSQKIIVLLGQHDVIDINALINEHNLNRNTFLQTVKKLEKAELLRIVKANGRGKTAKFLERVA